jgi:hypothetical protein
MKAEVEVVQRQDVVNMIADINDVFCRVEEEGIDQNGYDSNEYIVFKQIRKDIIKAINVHMNDMDKE